MNKELVPALAGTSVLRELRTQTFLPWNKKLWDTPNVAHDNPADQRFQASLILGFTDAQERAGFTGRPPLQLAKHGVGSGGLSID